MKKHIVQTKEWGEFKSAYGTHAINVGDIQYTLHKIPKTKLYYAYAPKIVTPNIKWKELEQSLKKNNCFVLNFDVPNAKKRFGRSKKNNSTF